MPNNKPKKKKGELMPGTLVRSESGRYIAFYEHRTDIIANGENEKEALKNLRKMYKMVKDHEDAEAESEKEADKLPESFHIKRFKDKIEC